MVIRLDCDIRLMNVLYGLTYRRWSKLYFKNQSAAVYTKKSEKIYIYFKTCFTSFQALFSRTKIIIREYEFSNQN